MEISENDQQVLRALAAACADHEELAELLSFYYELYEVQFKAKAGFPEPEVRDELAMRWRLEGGIPQLTFDQLGIEPESFRCLVLSTADVLQRHNPTWEIAREDWTPRKLVDIAREVFDSWDTLTAPKPGSEEMAENTPEGVQPMTLAVGFALAPYLQRAAEVILPRLDLSLWTWGYCPVCGGRPNLAMLTAPRGARQLACSRCASLWGYSRMGCPFCKSQEKQNYYLSEDKVYRLYTCPNCNRYLKTVDLRELHREVLPVVERLLTVGMDLAAQQEGYAG
jgi:hypothetical protein